MTYEEVTELAKAAATAYIIGAHIQDPKLAVDKFMEAYNYSLKNSLRALKEENNNTNDVGPEPRKIADSLFDNFSDFNKHF